MLTERALYDRQWNEYPAIAKLLNGKKLSVDWTGPTSVSNNVFEQTARILRTYALVRDNEEEVKLAVAAEVHAREEAHKQRKEELLKQLLQDDNKGETVRSNLRRLSGELKWASEFFAEAAAESKKLGRN